MTWLDLTSLGSPCPPPSHPSAGRHYVLAHLPTHSPTHLPSHLLTEVLTYQLTDLLRTASAVRSMLEPSLLPVDRSAHPQRSNLALLSPRASTARADFAGRRGGGVPPPAAPMVCASRIGKRATDPNLNPNPNPNPNPGTPEPHGQVGDCRLVDGPRPFRRLWSGVAAAHRYVCHGAALISNPNPNPNPNPHPTHSP